MMKIRRNLDELHNGQDGLTLIEVLVVMTILGILAAIVSISLLGVTGSAHDKGKNTEMRIVQTAFDAMVLDQQVSSADIAVHCNGSSPHNDMTAWPSGGVAYTNPGSAGWVPGQVIVLADHYVRNPHTQYDYSCDTSGVLKQSNTPHVGAPN